MAAEGLVRHVKLSCDVALSLPVVWLGQSVRTTVVTKHYPALAREAWMVSLGDAVHRPRLIERVFCGDLRNRLSAHGPLMLDSGGFTMMTRNRSLNVSEIGNIYRTARVELCISLDLPPTRNHDSRARTRKYHRTQENLAYLVDIVGYKRLVPVIHGVNETEVSENCRLTFRTHL